MLHYSEAVMFQLTTPTLVRESKSRKNDHARTKISCAKRRRFIAVDITLKHPASYKSSVHGHEICCIRGV